MNILKRTLALILTVFMGLSYVSAYAETEYADIKGTRYSEPAVFFQQLGVIKALEEENFKPEVGITRAEFAIMLAAILGCEDVMALEQAPFEDVPEENPAKTAIQYLYNFNVMIGMSSSVFSPNEGISYHDAALAIAKALGYASITEMDFYGQVAEAGFAKGCKLNDEVLTRGDACVMLFNALTTPLVEAEYTSNGAVYRKNKAKTALSKFLNASIYTGIVTATGECCLYGDADLEDNEIGIDYTTYTCELNSKESFVGHRVKYYVRENKNGDKTVIAILDKSDFSTIVSYKDILPTSTIKEIKYVPNQKTVTRRTNDDTFFVYNGMPITQGLTDSLIVPEYGEVELIDNDNNGVLDVVIIRDYKVYQVETLSSASGLIKFKDADFTVNTDNEGVFVSRNGEKVTEDTVIGRDEVAAVAVSIDGRRTIVKLSDKTVTGTVSKVNPALDEITVGEKQYGVTPFVGEIEVKFSGEFYLDCFGNIAFWKEGRDFKYGWFVKAAADSFAENAKLKILTENGKVEILTAKKKVNIYQGGVLQFTVLSETLESHLAQPQMIRYKINDKDEICEIYKFDEKEPGDFGCEGFARNVVSTGRCYLHTKGYVYDQYNPKEKSAMLDDDAVIFNLGRAGDKEEKWTVKKISDGITSGYFERVQVFDIDKYGAAACVLLYETDYQTFAVTDPIILVQEVMTAMKEDGESELVISGTSHRLGEEISVRTDNKSLPSNPTAVGIVKNLPISSVNTGDVIQCHMDIDTNEIISWRLLQKVGDYTERAYYSTATTEIVQGSEVSGLCSFGTIYSAGDKGFTISNEYLPKKRAYKFLDTDNQVLLRFDTSKETVQKISKSDIYSGMKVFMYAQPESGYVFMVEYK